jgi:SSS family solute:Na+ symporter
VALRGAFYTLRHPAGGELHVGAIDYGVLIVYLGLLIGLGFWAQRRQKDVEDYYVAGRRLGPVTVACLWIAAWIGGAAVVGTSTRVYEYGVTGVWYVLAQAIGCVLFGLFVAARIKRLGDLHRHLTYPDFIEQHYDSRTRIVATVTTVLAFTAYSAGQLAASAAILQVMVGWNYEFSLAVAGAIVILYTAVGGYLAVTYTDWVQVILLLLGVVVIGIPVAITHAGSWDAMQAALPASYYDLGAQGWGRIAALVVSMVLAFFVGMDSFSRCFAARNAAAAKNGALLAALLIVPLAIAAVWLGLAAAVLYPDHATAGSSILAKFVLDAFPPGLKGLMLIAVLSAIMSTADICILTASANYTRDIHQRFIRPDLSPRAMLRLGTLASVAVGLLSMLLAWKMRDIIDILQLGFTINAAGLFLPTIAALYGNRVPAAAAFWSIGASLATVVGWRIAADAGAGGVFALDPLWPGLAVSLALMGVLTLLSPRRPARAMA